MITRQKKKYKSLRPRLQEFFFGAPFFIKTKLKKLNFFPSFFSFSQQANYYCQLSLIRTQETIDDFFLPSLAWFFCGKVLSNWQLRTYLAEEEEEKGKKTKYKRCLLYTSDAADE